MVKKFRHHFSLAALLMVVVLLAGCIGGGTTKEEYTLNITVKLAEGGEGKVEDVGLKVDDKAVDVDADGKATASVTEGDVVVEAVLEGYVTYKETITVTKNAELTITLEIEEEPATEEELVAAVVTASEGNDEEAFLKALQALEEAGLVTGVEEDFAGLYLKQAQDYTSFVFAAAVPPFMRNAVEIQNNVINPVNEAVADAIKAVNTAVSTTELTNALTHLGTSLELLKDVEEANVDVYAALLKKYPSATLEDLQNIIDGASVKLGVVALFDDIEAKELELATGIGQKDIDAANKLVADVKIAGLKAELEDLIAVAQGLVDDVVFESVDKQIKELFEIGDDGKFVKDDDGELTLVGDKDAIEAAQKALDAYKGSKSTAELQALIDKAEELLAKADEENLVERINDEAAEGLATLIINELKVGEFIDLSAAQRAEVAGRLVDARSADGYEAYESSADFILAVEAEIEVYLGLIDAVNNAANKLDMVAALSAINEDYANLELDAKLPLAEAMYAKVTDKDFVKYTTLADIKTAAEW